MARKDTINTEGGPTLFDAVQPQETPQTGQGAAPQGLNTAADVFGDLDRVAEGWQAQAPTEGKADQPDEWAEIMEIVAEVRRDAERAGVWVLLPPETLLRRGELYYNQRVEQIRKTMTDAGANEAAVVAVCHDYAGVLSGTCRFAADAVQMQDALKALPPAVAFNIDRVGLYFGVLLNYSRFLERFGEYVATVKGEQATEDTKRAFISGFYPAMDARAVDWLLFNGYMAPSDFSGFDPAEMRQFFDRIDAVSKLADYTLYYTVARLALVATPDECEALTPPPHIGNLRIENENIPFSLFCEYLVTDTVDRLNKAAAKFTEAATADVPTAQVQEQARQAARDWNDDTNAVKIHQNFGLVLSRPVHVAPNETNPFQTLPIQPYIDEFNAHPIRFGNIETYGTVTEQSVQRVFEGLNLLPQYLSRQAKRTENGRYVFRTNLNEFAEICGYADAGLNDQRALLGALLILRNLYFVVDKPLKWVEFVDRKGRNRRRREGGPTAIQFLNVPEIGLKTGELVIELYPDCLKGTPTYLHATTFKKLRAHNKSTPQSRFNYQIATKSHKSERDLIDDVFGLRDMVEQAKTEAERKHVKTYIQNHRPRYRAKVLAWFDEYVRDGILTEFGRVPSKTDKRDFVLSWTCPDTSKLNPPPSHDGADDVDEQ